MSNVFWPTFLVTTIVTFFIVVQFRHAPPWITENLCAQSNSMWTDGKRRASLNHASSSAVPENTTYLVHSFVARFLRRDENGPTAKDRATSEKLNLNKPLPERPASTSEKPISVSLIRQRNTWLIPIGVGTPPQNFPVIIDTSSSDSWVFTTEFKNKEYQTQRKYDPSKSGTADKIGSRVLQFPCRGGVTAEGAAYRDTMTFAGTEFKLTEQYFVGTTKLSGLPPQPRFYGGILGLAYPALSYKVRKPSFIHNAVLESVIAKPIFAFYLSRGQSELHLGGTDKDFYTGDIQYRPVYKAKIRGFDYPFYWIIPGGQINVNNKKISDVHAAIDIRTAFIRGPREEVNLIYDSMGVEHRKIHDFHAFPCDKVPTVSFQWGNKKWVIAPENFKLDQLTSNPAMCAGVIQEDSRLASIPRKWILGAWFMMNVYTVFDANSETPQVGFGTLRDSVVS